MITTPRVYYRNIGTGPSVQTKDVVFNAVKAIVESNQLQFWENAGTTDTEVIIKNKTSGRNDLHDLQFKFYRDPSARENCLGRLSVDGGSTWSSPSSMTGGHNHATYGFAFNKQLLIGRKVYVVEVEDAIFVYTQCDGRSNNITITVYNGDLCYGIAAGNIIQTFDITNHFKGSAIIGGIPCIGTGSFSSTYTMNNSNSMVSTWFASINQTASNITVNNWAHYNGDWIKFGLPIPIPNWTPFRTTYWDSTTPDKKQRGRGLLLYSLNPPEGSSGDKGSVKSVLGISKYHRQIERTASSNLQASISGDASIGWMNNRLLSGAYYSLHTGCLIWCPSTSNEILIP